MVLNSDSIIKALMTLGLFILLLGIFLSVYDLYVSGLIPLNALIILVGFLLMIGTIGLSKIIEAV